MASINFVISFDKGMYGQRDAELALNAKRTKARKQNARRCAWT